MLESNNPFALAILAGQYAIGTKQNVHQRFIFKRKLFKLLLKEERVYNKEDIYALLYFFDFLLTVPKSMEKELQSEMSTYLGKGELDMSGFADMGLPPTLKGIIEDWRNEGKIEGKREGKIEGKMEKQKEIAINMLNEGMSLDFIARVTKLKKEEIEKIKNELE